VDLSKVLALLQPGDSICKSSWRLLIGLDDDAHPLTTDFIDQTLDKYEKYV
jgi:hypothetical protein